MPSTYSINIGLEKPATGEQTGTWGETANKNFDLIDEALGGSIVVTLPTTGSPNSPHVLQISDGLSSPGRHMHLEFRSSATLNAPAYVQLQPNDAQRVVFVRNALSGGTDPLNPIPQLVLFQGNYSENRRAVIPYSRDAIIRFTGEGANSRAENVLQNPHFLEKVFAQALHAEQASIGDMSLVDNTIWGGGEVGHLHLQPRWGTSGKVMITAPYMNLAALDSPNPLPVELGGTGTTNLAFLKSALNVLEPNDDINWTGAHTYGLKTLSINLGVGTIDWSAGNFFFAPLSGNVTLTDVNRSSRTQVIYIMFTGGPSTVSTPGTWKWAGGGTSRTVSGSCLFRITTIIGSLPFVEFVA